MVSTLQKPLTSTCWNANTISCYIKAEAIMVEEVVATPEEVAPRKEKKGALEAEGNKRCALCVLK